MFYNIEGEQLFFSGGERTFSNMLPSNRVDILDVTSNSWSTDTLSIPMDAAIGASVGNKIMVAGGENYYAGTFTDVVNVFTSPTVSGLQESKVNELFNVWPNPAKDYITIETLDDHPGRKITIYSMHGQKLSEQMLSAKKSVINICNFHAGIYFAEYQNDSGTEVKKILIN